ncbi:MAG TPA: transglycosylase domain-containing protein, partial [Rhodocyclaceae bacterium]|nr:transglycosylase domain-containing protein [Rhodocyclaceae bacterium]
MRLIAYPLLVIAGLAAIGIALALIVLALTYPKLPSLEVLTDYRPKIPLRVYTADGHLIGEFGEERRAVVAINDVPAVMKQAILAAEDERFYQHGGVDTLGIMRAAVVNLVGGGKKQGASTITQQVARNFFLSGEKTYTRKLYEVLLSFKIENNLSKDQILELYINQIFLGQRAYGFAAAAQIYFGKPLKEISIAEAAMLAGLPKAPSAYNPVVNPNRAKLRQQYVLRRMHELGYITDTQYAAAIKEPLVVKRELSGYAVHAEYVAEMARQIAAERFPEEVYSRGMKVYTTLIKA